MGNPKICKPSSGNFVILGFPNFRVFWSPPRRNVFLGLDVLRYSYFCVFFRVAGFTQNLIDRLMAYTIVFEKDNHEQFVKISPLYLSVSNSKLFILAFDVVIGLFDKIAKVSKFSSY